MFTQPILDAHVHLWNPTRLRIPWLDNIPMLNQLYDLSRYREATAGLDIAGLVYLQVEVAPVYSLMEAQEIADLAVSESIVAAIVPWAPLEYGLQLRAYLEELTQISPLIKGVRRLTQDEPDPELCLQPGFIQGARMLAEFGLSCDLCCRYLQLRPTVELVRQVPETEFILDHIAKPNIRENEFEPWASQIRDLAGLPNIVCKVSGVVTETDGSDWTVEEISPYVEHVIECFGEDRIVFGSDWPVVTQASEYLRWAEALHQITSTMSATARRKLWQENGERFYRIGVEMDSSQ